MSYIVLCPTCEELVTKVYEPDGLCDSCTAESFGLPNLPVEALTPWYEVEELRHYESRCPACGDVIDYCQGHGEIGDPQGFAILQAHDDGDHSGCRDEEE